MSMANHPEVSETILTITKDPSKFTIDSVYMKRLERWTVLMYSKNGDSALVNEARKTMESLDSISPTQHTLFQHAKRAQLTAAFLSGKMHVYI